MKKREAVCILLLWGFTLLYCVALHVFGPENPLEERVSNLEDIVLFMFEEMR